MDSTMTLLTLPQWLQDKIQPEPMSGCWLWTGNTNGRGYGRVYLGARRQPLAHRVVYELTRGSVPIGLELDHRCRVTLCVNPDHLDAVSHAVNIGRALQHGPLPRSTCQRGHSMEKARIRTKHGRPYRLCRVCMNIAKRAARVRLKEFSCEASSPV
jgi:hypothetical protein